VARADGSVTALDHEARRVLRALQDWYIVWAGREDPTLEPTSPSMEMVTLTRATGLAPVAVERACDELDRLGFVTHVGRGFLVSLSEKGIAAIPPVRRPPGR
jgi:hypothetical protein